MSHSQPSLSFNDMLKATRDYNYLSTIAGAKTLTKESGKYLATHIKEFIVEHVTLAIIIVMIICVLYLFFYGYPRLSTLYHKESMNNLFTDTKLTSSLNDLINKTDICPTFYQIMSCNLIGINLNEFQGSCQSLHNIINNYDDTESALKEYFLFFNPINDLITQSSDKSSIRTYDFNGASFNMTDNEYNLYEGWITYQISVGKIHVNKKGENELLYDLWIEGGENKSSEIKNKLVDLHNTVNTFRENIQSLAMNIDGKALRLSDIFQHVVLPGSNMAKSYEFMLDNSNQSFPKGNYTFVILEISKYVETTDANPQVFIEYLNELGNDNNLGPYVNIYLNLPEKNRILYIDGLKKDLIKFQSGKLKITKSNIDKYQTVDEFLSKVSWISEHPIWSRIYFSKTNKGLEWKKGLYAWVMTIYTTIFSLRFNNCNIIYKNFQETITNFSSDYNDIENNLIVLKKFAYDTDLILLYFSNYFNDIITNYQAQMRSKNKFFHDLWTPYYDDLLVNRMWSYFTRVFAGNNMNNSWSNFKVFWNQLGNKIKAMPGELLKIVNNPNTQIQQGGSIIDNNFVALPLPKKNNSTVSGQNQQYIGGNIKYPGQKIADSYENFTEDNTNKMPIDNFGGFGGDVIEGFGFLGGLVNGIISIGKFFIALLQTALAVAKLVGQLTRDPFGTIMKIIMLLVGTIVAVILMLAYFVISIPPFILGPWLIYFTIFEIVPFVAYCIVFALLLAFITVICLILTVINVITNGFIKDVVLCQNPPDAWCKFTNYQLGNKYERNLLCSNPCSGNFAPDKTTGVMCKKNNWIQPSFCPQAEIWRIWSGTSNELNWIYGDFQAIGNTSYARQTPGEKRQTLKKYYLQRKSFLDQCKKSTKEYDFLCKSVCMNLDNGNLSNSDKKKITGLCNQLYCNSKNSLLSCTDSTTLSDMKIKSFAQRIVLIVIITIFVLILIYTCLSLLR